MRKTHLENQLLPTIGDSNSTVCSAPPLSWITNHAPKQQVTSSRHSILESITSFHDGLIKQKNAQHMHSTIIFPMHNMTLRDIPVHSYIQILPKSYAIPIKSPIKSLNPYDLGSCLVVEFGLDLIGINHISLLTHVIWCHGWCPLMQLSSPSVIFFIYK